MQIEVFKGKRRWHWHMRASNGQVVATSQGYFSRWNAKRAAIKLARNNSYRLFVDGQKVPSV